MTGNNGTALAAENALETFDPARVPSPCFVVDEQAVERNLKILHRVQEESGARVLAALKAFSLWRLAPLVAKYLSGTCASGLHEARLGREEYGGEVHVFSAAYTEQDLREILKLADHVVFNSFSQWQRFQPLVQEAKKARPVCALACVSTPSTPRAMCPFMIPVPLVLDWVFPCHSLKGNPWRVLPGCIFIPSVNRMWNP